MGLKGMWDLFCDWIRSFSLAFPDPDVQLLEEEFDEPYH